MSGGINSVSATNGIAGVSHDSTGDLQALLVGDVIANYDDQIKVFSDEIEATTAKKSEITALKSQINGVPTAGSGDNTKLGAYHEYSPTHYKKLSALAATVGMAGTVTEGTDSSHANYYVSDDVIADIQAALDNKLADLNSNSDIKMIGFQALMDARKQSLMMLSNMISSDNQTKMAILQNLKG